MMKKIIYDGHGILIFLFLFCFLLATEAFYTSSINLSRYGIIIIQETGLKAQAWGIVFLLLGLFLSFLYFRPFKICLIKNLKWLKFTYLFWLLSISLPIYDLYCQKIIILKIFTVILTIILSYFFNKKLIDLSRKNV